MNKLVILLFTVIITTHCVADDADQAEHDVTTPNSSTTSSSTTTSTTTTPITTTASTTTSTTTTTKPTTTSPTTPKPTTTTPTTLKPTTTTSPTPTTPAPTPSPTPEGPSDGTWTLNRQNSNDTCIIVHFAMQLQIPYMHVSQKLVNATVNIPSNATVLKGDCSKDTENNIVIQWSYPDNKTDQLQMNFVTNNSKYHLQGIEFTIEPDSTNFPGIKDTTPITLKYVHDNFETSMNKSYKCEKKEEFNLTLNDNNIGGLMFISHLQLQAFGYSKDNSTFYSAEDCAPFDTPDIVPIAVGCALAALVIIVLITYLIGRRRRQSRGYLSMFTETKNESDYIPMKNLSCFQ